MLFWYLTLVVDPRRAKQPRCMCISKNPSPKVCLCVCVYMLQTRGTELFQEELK
jgi:hypothetical protein